MFCKIQTSIIIANLCKQIPLILSSFINFKFFSFCNNRLFFSNKYSGQEQNYLSYFFKAENKNIFFDSLQSEDSSRFYKKRNRNIVALANDDFEEELLPDIFGLIYFKFLF